MQGRRVACRDVVKDQKAGHMRSGHPHVQKRTTIWVKKGKLYIKLQIPKAKGIGLGIDTVRFLRRKA